MKKQLPYDLAKILANGPEKSLAGEGYAGYQPGVTVEADKESPTGFKATFLYAEQEKYEGLIGRVVRVRLYSSCMNLFDPKENPGILKKNYVPFEEMDPILQRPGKERTYRDGLFPGGGYEEVFWYGEMEHLGDGLWGIQVFLPSGAYPYNYEVTDELGNRVRGLDDPANPSLRHGVTGDRSYSSMVYVPYDKVQGKGEFLGRFYADRSVELPRRNRSGRVEFVTYESYFGPERGLAVYLPIDYREQSEDPYKVLYLSHGAVGEDYGGELRWMQEGDVPCILDNLIASGKVEPFLVVTMDNQYLGGEYWDFDYILREQERIMAYVEEHYHVSSKPEDRAYAGIGEGGIVASQMLLSRPDLFGYYGFWSECSSDVLEIKSVLSKNKDVHLMLGCGLWETADSILVLRDELKKRNLLEDMLIVPGACDWKTRQLLFAYAA
ncbi:MAG: hypothetical protein IIZ39_06585, partial [Blautia sp.]|nr:hypothetical protein [Blautia sp.]